MYNLISGRQPRPQVPRLSKKSAKEPPVIEVIKIWPTDENMSLTSTELKPAVPVKTQTPARKQRNIGLCLCTKMITRIDLYRVRVILTTAVAACAGYVSPVAHLRCSCVVLYLDAVVICGLV